MRKIVLRDEGQVLKKSKLNELEFGLLPDRKKIGRYRNNEYADIKHNQNPLAGFGNVDLIRTGAFSSGLFPVGHTNYFLFDSPDPKTPDLKKKYGESIMGLNQKTFDRLQEDVYRKKLANFIKAQLGQNAKTTATR